MFKVGDKVKFKKSSLDSGMINATESDVFEVAHSYVTHLYLKDAGLSLAGWWNVSHFEHVKGEVMNNTEEQEIKWEVGQEVFCLLRGKGVVCSILSKDVPYPVEVEFEDTFDRYTIDGRMYDDHKNRVLFFSEPKIEAEKFPPKKPFVAKLKNGDIVFVKHKNLYKECYTLEVDYEDEDAVWFKNENEGYLKSAWNFFKIGEEIIFN